MELIALLLGIALPVGAVVALVARGKHQIDAAEAYRAVSGNLGLMVDTRGVSVQGHLGDRRLWVGEVMVGHGPDRRTAVWGVLDMRRPLGLGLQVRRRGLSERVFRRGRAPGVELGDEGLDKRVEVLGDDPSRVRALMGDREVKGALSELMARCPDVVVTDISVRVHLPRPLTTERALQALVDGMIRLSAALEQARRGVPAPERLQAVAREWADLEGDGLQLEPWLPALAGEVGGRALVIAAWRADEGYQGDLRLYFNRHRDMGLRVSPQVEPDGYWSVGQDIQLGDARFDERFVIKGWDPGRVREQLDAGAREALLRAARLGHLQVDDRRLHLRDLPLGADAIREAVRAAVAVADALGW